MPISPLIISAVESCPRRALWSTSWESKELSPVEILRRGLYEGLTTPRQDFEEAAGEFVMEFAGDRGFHIPPTVHQSTYDVALHHASLADILSSHLRDIGPWQRPDPVDGWESMCFVEGNELRRIVLTSWWDEERLQAEMHSWYTLGEMAVYQMPMSLDVVILGPYRRGRRHSAWMRGFLHPRNRKLRFKRNAHYGERDKPFGDNWIAVWREDRDEIEREAWLQAMDEDRMLEELHLEIPIAMPSPANMQRLRTLIARKTEQLEKLKGRPLPNYSQCDSVINPCPFKECCWPNDVVPSESAGYVNLEI